MLVQCYSKNEPWGNGTSEEGRVPALLAIQVGVTLGLSSRELWELTVHCRPTCKAWSWTEVEAPIHLFTTRNISFIASAPWIQCLKGIDPK